MHVHMRIGCIGHGDKRVSENVGSGVIREVHLSEPLWGFGDAELWGCSDDQCGLLECIGGGDAIWGRVMQGVGSGPARKCQRARGGNTMVG